MARSPTIPKAAPVEVDTVRTGRNAFPTLLYFWAHWCGPCTRMNKTVEALAEMPVINGLGKVVVLGVNVDEEASFTNYAGVTSIPTLMLQLPGKEHVNRPLLLCGDRKLVDVLAWLSLNAPPSEGSHDYMPENLGGG